MGLDIYKTDKCLYQKKKWNRILLHCQSGESAKRDAALVGHSKSNLHR